MPKTMRASMWLLLEGGFSCALLASLAGCGKEVKADFPRPPATASMPAPDEEPPEPAPAPVEEAPALPSTDDVEPEREVEPPPSPREAARRPLPSPEAPLEEEAPAGPPSTQLAGTVEADRELTSKLERVSSLLGFVGGRRLTSEQARQLTAAEAFVSQARQAISDGDQRRALVLIDKGLILAQDVERLSRP